MLIRLMRAEDAKSAARIDAQSNPTPWSAAQFAQDLTLPQSRALVAEEGASVCAFIVAWAVQDRLEILELAVEAGARRKGVGRKLVEELCSRYSAASAAGAAETSAAAGTAGAAQAAGITEAAGTVAAALVAGTTAGAAQAADNETPGAKCNSAELELRADNFAALELYKKCGFSVVGRRPKFYDNPGGLRTDAVLMSKNLLCR